MTITIVHSLLGEALLVATGLVLYFGDIVALTIAKVSCKHNFSFSKAVHFHNFLFLWNHPVNRYMDT